MNETRNSKLLEDFTRYCQKYPEQRFWQALRNWSGYPFVLVSDTKKTTDTFFWEGKDK